MLLNRQLGSSAIEGDTNGDHSPWHPPRCRAHVAQHVSDQRRHRPGELLGIDLHDRNNTFANVDPERHVLSYGLRRQHRELG